MNVAALEAAARAAYPEAWDSEGKDAGEKAMLSHLRSSAMQRISNGVEAYLEAMPDMLIELPEDTAMVQQSLTVFAALDSEGKQTYGVRTLGEGLLVTWLGMSQLAQHYLTEQYADMTWKRRSGDE